MTLARFQVFGSRRWPMATLSYSTELPVPAGALQLHYPVPFRGLRRSREVSREHFLSTETLSGLRALSVLIALHTRPLSEAAFVGRETFPVGKWLPSQKPLLSVDTCLCAALSKPRALSVEGRQPGICKQSSKWRACGAGVRSLGKNLRVLQVD